MNKKVYICDVDVACPDYAFVREVVEVHGDAIASMDAAELCLFPVGAYISGHNAKGFEEQLHRALGSQKSIVILKPYGTSYLPLLFRRMRLDAIELLRSQIEDVLEERTPDSGKLLYSRYC